MHGSARARQARAHSITLVGEICDSSAGADIGKGKCMRRVVVRRSPVHGKGVFTLHALAAAERVLEYKGEITSWRNAVRRHQHEGVEGHTFLWPVGRAGDRRPPWRQQRALAQSCLRAQLRDYRGWDGFSSIQSGQSSLVRSCLLNICWRRTDLSMRTFEPSTRAGVLQKAAVSRCWRTRRDGGDANTRSDVLAKGLGQLPAIRINRPYIHFGTDGRLRD
ncbi:hypothetical protein BX589_1378 [Paraburkholderia fungorum]|nr:hypothetical protein BX589_1378 [Paraburkholderia fungorum]